MELRLKVSSCFSILIGSILGGMSSYFQLRIGVRDE